MHQGMTQGLTQGIAQGMDKSAMPPLVAWGVIPAVTALSTYFGVKGSADEMSKGIQEQAKTRMDKLMGQASGAIDIFAKPIPGLDKIPGIGRYMNPLMLASAGGIYLMYKNLKKMKEMQKDKKNDNTALNKLVSQNENLINMAMNNKNETNEFGAVGSPRSRRRKKLYANLGENVLGRGMELVGDMNL